jgi:hypothetical protein
MSYRMNRIDGFSFNGNEERLETFQLSGTSWQKARKYKERICLMRKDVSIAVHCAMFWESFWVRIMLRHWFVALAIATKRIPFSVSSC